MNMKILIIIVTVIGILAVVAAIIIGTRTFEGIVVEKPYERGLAWDEEQRENRELGWNIDLKNSRFTTGENELSFSVLDRSGDPLTDASVAVTVSRPSTSAYDRTYRDIELQGTAFRSRIDLPLYGNWDLKILVTRGENHGLLRKNIFAEKN